MLLTRFRLVFLGHALASLCYVLSWAQTPAAPIHRILMEIRLGDSLSQVKKTYPPSQPWHMSQEPNGGITRIQVQRTDCQLFPVGVDRISLETLGDRVIEVKAVFDAAHTRKQPLTTLVTELSEQYGAPSRMNMTYGWQDNHTLIKAFDEALPLKKGKGVELRTAIELIDLDVYRTLRR